MAVAHRVLDLRVEPVDEVLVGNAEPEALDARARSAALVVAGPARRPTVESSGSRPGDHLEQRAPHPRRRCANGPIWSSDEAKAISP